MELEIKAKSDSNVIGPKDIESIRIDGMDFTNKINYLSITIDSTSLLKWKLGLI